MAVDVGGVTIFAFPPIWPPPMRCSLRRVPPLRRRPSGQMLKPRRPTRRRIVPSALPGRQKKFDISGSPSTRLRLVGKFTLPMTAYDLFKLPRLIGVSS